MPSSFRSSIRPSRQGILLYLRGNLSEFVWNYSPVVCYYVFQRMNKQFNTEPSDKTLLKRLIPVKSMKLSKLKAFEHSLHHVRRSLFVLLGCTVASLVSTPGSRTFTSRTTSSATSGGGSLAIGGATLSGASPLATVTGLDSSKWSKISLVTEGTHKRQSL